MRNRTIVIVFGLTALTGCPDGKPQGDLPPLHPAKGTVVRKGIPVAGEWSGSSRSRMSPT